METEEKINESLIHAENLKVPGKLKAIYKEAQQRELEGRLDNFSWEVYSTPPVRSPDERVNMSSREFEIQAIHDIESANLREAREQRLKDMAEKAIFEKREETQRVKDLISKERAGMSFSEELEINNQIAEKVKQG